MSTDNTPSNNDDDDDEQPPYRDGFVCGSGLSDPENARWTHEVYDTREEAIERARALGKLQTASIRCEKHFMPNPLDAERACTDAENDEFGEAMLENWQDKVFDQRRNLLDELQATLDKVWSEFENKHKLWVWGYWFDDVESVPEVTPAPEPPAIEHVEAT